MMKRRGLLLGLAAVAAGSAVKFSGWNWQENNKINRKSLLIGGASAMYAVNQALKKEFLAINNCCDMSIEQGGSLQGFIAVKRGAIDLAAMSRDLTDDEDEADAHHYLIARGFITIIVNKNSPIKNLSRQQIYAVFTGTISNWKMLGGADAKINIISRARGSSTRQYVEESVIDGAEFTNNTKEYTSTVLVAKAVSEDDHAIGYIASKDSAGINTVAFLNIDNVSASPISVLSNRYAYTQSFYLMIYGEQKGVAFDFINFARSSAGQSIVERQGLVSVC